MLLRLLLIAFSTCALLAQTTNPPSPNPPVPTTKVLAIGHLTPNPDRAQIMKIFPTEVRETVKLYLGGKIDQWFVRKDQNGVVFLMNVTTVEEAHALLEKLPFGEAKIMEFELIPLGPLSPLYQILKPAAAPQP